MQREEEIFEKLSALIGTKGEKPGDLLPLLASRASSDSSVFVRSLIEAAIFWQEGHNCSAVFAAIPSKHLDQACQHAISVLPRLEQGLTKSNLLEAVSRRWPIDALKVAPELPTDEDRARVIGWLVIHRTFRASLLRLARGLKDPFWRGVALQSLMKDAPPDSLAQLSREFVAAARQSGDAALLEEAWRRFVGPVSAEELEQGLADMRARESPSRRAVLGRGLLRLVAPESRGEVAQELLSAVRQHGPSERAEALGEGGRYLPEEFVPEALELVRDTPGGESWFRAHEGLAPYLSEEQLDRLLVETEGLAPEARLRVCPELKATTVHLGIPVHEAMMDGLRLALLLAVLSRHPDRNRERILNKALAMIGGLQARSAQVGALERLGPLLSALPEPLERLAAGLMTEPATRSRLIRAVGPLLSSPVILSLLETWVHTLAGEDRAEAFAGLARMVREERLWEVVSLLQRSGAPVPAWGLAAFTPRLGEAATGELLRPVWEALRQSRDEDETRELFSLLIRCSPDSRLQDVFELGAREWFARTSWFRYLVVRASQETPALIPQAIALTREIEDPRERFAELNPLLSRLPAQVRSQVVQGLWIEAQRERDAKARAISLVRLAPQVGRADLHKVTEEALDALEAPEVHAELRGELLHELAQGLGDLLTRSSVERAFRMAMQLDPATSSYRKNALVALLSRVGRSFLQFEREPGEAKFSAHYWHTYAESEHFTPVVRGPLSEGFQTFKEPPTEPPRPPPASPQELSQLSREALQRMSPPAEPVLLGTSAPAEVSSGDAFTARFVACVERLEREVTEKLELWSPGTKTLIRFQRCQWQLGSRFRVRVTSPHLAVSPEEQEFIWNADACLLDFGVQVPSSIRGRRTSLQFEVLFDGTRVALLRHDLSLVARKQAPGERRMRLGRAPRTAFASYAADDRDRVLDRVASLQLAAGLQVFMDCLSLRPGEHWKEALRAEILQRDLFLLFWSRKARSSKWVKWEWRTALRLKGRDSIQPHPLEPYPIAPPPKELAMLHFGDPHMLVRRDKR